MFAKLRHATLFIFIAVLTSCKTTRVACPAAPVAGMFRVSILYPNGDDKTFDMNYYEQKHMPMVAAYLGKNLKFYEIDKGISGRTANEKPPFLAIGYFYVTDIAEYNKAIGEHRDTIISDFKNYTNVQPVVQVNEIKQANNGIAK